MESIISRITSARQFISQGIQSLGGVTSSSNKSDLPFEPGLTIPEQVAKTNLPFEPGLPEGDQGIIINPDVYSYDSEVTAPENNVGPNTDIPHYVPTQQPPSPHPMTLELANVPYDQLQMVSSHNSYQTEVHGDQTLTQQFEQDGIHSFELDIHIGDAGIDIPFLSPDVHLEDDYYVYHDSSDTIIPGTDGILADSDHHLGSGTNYENLTEGLQEINSLNNEMPVTLFVDVKDTLNGDHGPDVLNNLLTGELENIYTPQDLMDWAGTDNLQDAIANGWPTAEELNGRVLVVLTGDLNGYIEGSENPAAFIAPTPQTDAHAEGFEHVPDPNAIFYNTDDPDIAEGIRNEGYPIRVYGFDSPNADAQASDANHLGTNDIDPDTNGYPDSSSDTDPFNVLDPALG